MMSHYVGTVLGQMLIHQPHNVNKFFLSLSDVPRMVVWGFVELTAEKSTAQRVGDIVGDLIHPLFDCLSTSRIVGE